MKSLFQFASLVYTIIIVFSLSLMHGFTAVAEDSFDENNPTTINISANPLAPNLVEYGKAASIMRKDEIQNRAQTTLGETVGLEPGVSSSFFGQGASRPVIRGFSGERVRMLKNGVGTGDVSDISEDHVVVADPLQANQIEILRGPETLLYGSSAIGGSVNVVDDSIAEESLGTPFLGEYLAQLGNSADNEKTGALKLKGEFESFNWYLSGFSRETDSYEIPGFAESEAQMEKEEEEHADHEEEQETKGKVLNSDSDTSGATAALSHVWDEGFIGIAVNQFDSNYGVPGHSHSEDEDSHDEEEEQAHSHDENVRLDVDEFRVDMRGRVDKVSNNINAVKFRMAVSDYQHKEIEGGVVGTTFNRNIFESRVELLHEKVAGLKGAVGVQMLYDDFAAVGDEAFLVPTKTFTPALFSFEELTLNEQWDLEFGARVENVNHSPLGLASQNFVPLSFSAGPVWNPDGSGDYNIGLTFAYSERAPSSVELFADGPHLARQIYEIGNKDLDLEESWGVDLALRKNTGFLQSVLTPFYQDFSNYVNLAANGEETEGLPIYNYEGIEAKFWGFEFQNSLHFEKIADFGLPSLILEHQIDYVRARNESESEDLPRIPPLRNIIRLKSELSESLEAMLEGVFVAKQSDTAEFELETDSYTLLNTMLSYKIGISEEHGLKLFAKGTNLSNEEARVHSSFLKDLAPLRGRAFIFGLSGTF